MSPSLHDQLAQERTRYGHAPDPTSDPKPPHAPPPPGPDVNPEIDDPTPITPPAPVREPRAPAPPAIACDQARHAGRPVGGLH